MKKQILFLVIFLYQVGSPISTSAQESETPSRWAAQFNIQNQELTISNFFFFGQLETAFYTPIHPNFSSDIQFNLNRGPKRRFFLSGNIGYFNDLYLEKWFNFQLGVGFETKLYKKLFTSLRFQSGNVYVFNSDVQYELEDGIWVKSNQETPKYNGRLISLRMDIGHPVAIKNFKFDVVVNGQLSMMVIPDSWVAPYHALGIGLRYHL